MYYPELTKKFALNCASDYVPIRRFEKEFQYFYQDFLRSWKKKDNDYLYKGLLYLFSKLIVINEYCPQINVTLFSSHGSIYKEMLEEKINNLPNNIVIKEPNSGGVNIIISDCMINNVVKADIVYWNQKPTEKDWNLLKQKFDELEKKLSLIEVIRNG